MINSENKQYTFDTNKEKLYVCSVSRDIPISKDHVAIVGYQFPVNFMNSTISIISIHLKAKKSARCSV